MNRQEWADIDKIISGVSTARAHAETMLFYLFPYFDKAQPDPNAMRKIEWEYGHIMALLEVVQQCMTEIAAQENAWSEMLARMQKE